VAAYSAVGRRIEACGSRGNGDDQGGDGGCGLAGVTVEASVVRPVADAMRSG
jgi:hypothetical protein